MKDVNILSGVLGREAGEEWVKTGSRRPLRKTEQHQAG